MCQLRYLVLALLLPGCLAHLNVYLSQYEVMRLLGSVGERSPVPVETLYNTAEVTIIAEEHDPSTKQVQTPTTSHYDFVLGQQDEPTKTVSQEEELSEPDLEHQSYTDSEGPPKPIKWNALARKNLKTKIRPALKGLSAELYYVRDGMINDYALNFVVPVPATIGELHFTWQSLAGRPLPYTIRVEVSNKEALAPPELNVTREGFVPVTPQTWRVELPCTGVRAAEVDVTIALNVSTGAASTALHFRRRKICLKRDLRARTAVRVDTAPTTSTSADIFYAGAGCAVGALLLAVVAAAACRARARKIRRDVSGDEHDAHAFLPESSCKSAASYASFRRPTSVPAAAAEERARDLQERIAELTIQRCRVRLRSVSLEGTFGRVYRGTYTDEEGREQEVVVKTVAEHASQVQVSLLLQEGCSMYGLQHERLLSVLGVSIEDHTAPFLIYPHKGYRNMKKFLHKCRLTAEGVAHTLTTQDIVHMALQALDGLLYLHKKHIIHKDIAARNCVVDDSLRVQIADNALSRDLFPADYHCLGDNENRPVKWLAIEALQRRAFSPASDVWALGVLLWELTTLAQQPYTEVDPFEVAAYLRDGYRLAQPVNCPDELFAVMAYCWAMSPDDRPTLLQLQVFLKDFYAQLTQYV